MYQLDTFDSLILISLALISLVLSGFYDQMNLQHPYELVYLILCCLANIIKREKILFVGYFVLIKQKTTYPVF